MRKFIVAVVFTALGWSCVERGPLPEPPITVVISKCPRWIQPDAGLDQAEPSETIAKSR